MGRDRTRIERLEQLNNSSTVSDVTGTAPIVVTTPTVGVRNVAVTGLSGTNTGDQTITLTGDVTGSGTGSFAATIANSAVTTAKIADNAVTLAKLATQADSTILSNVSGGAAVPSANTLNATLAHILGNGTSGQAVVTDGSGNFSLGHVGGGSGGGLSFVGSATVAGSAVTTFSISGLDLTTDGRYFIFLTLFNATNTTTNVSLYYNSDTVSTNYNRQQLNASNTTVGGSRANDAVIGSMDGNAASTGSGGLTAQIWISTNPVGSFPIANAVSSRTGNSNILYQVFTTQWRTANTNVTGITISSVTASSIAVGSKIEVWKMTTT